MAPEYALRGNLSLKVDVFNFGILILETITGIKNIWEHTDEDFLFYVSVEKQGVINCITS